MKRPKHTTKPEEFFFETVNVALTSAAAHEKAKFITAYPSQPFRSAVVTAFVTCPDEMAMELVVAFNEAADLIFESHHMKVKSKAS